MDHTAHKTAGYRGVHARPWRRGMLAGVALTGVTLTVAAVAGVAHAVGATETATGAAAAQTPLVVATAAYSSTAYRAELEAHLGRTLPDANFAEIEAIVRKACASETDTFAAWVAATSDGNGLDRLAIDVRHGCAARLPEITATLETIAEARRTCVMPGIEDPSIQQMVAEKPAQSALTCVFLTRPILASPR